MFARLAHWLRHIAYSVATGTRKCQVCFEMRDAITGGICTGDKHHFVCKQDLPSKGADCPVGDCDGIIE